MKDFVYQYFQEHFKSSEGRSFGVANLNFKRLSDSDRLLHEEPFDADEIKTVRDAIEYISLRDDAN